MSLVLHKTERVEPTEPVAQWLSTLLNPVIQAAKFSRPPPLELRPTGQWGGWCEPRSFAADGRIIISNRVSFWKSESIISVYLHECAHRLLDACEVAAHGPEFFLLDLVLHLRCASFFVAEAAQKLSFYDLQDQPAELANEPAWRGIVIGWALPKADQIVADHGDKSAEEIVPIVLASWDEFLVQRAKSAALAEKKERQLVSQATQIQGRKEEITALKSDRNFWMVGTAVLIFFTVFLLAKLASK